MIVALELQLLRNWQPRSRPSKGVLDTDDGHESWTKLYPGAEANDSEEILIHITGAKQYLPQWITFAAELTIDGQRFSEPRPGTVYTGVSDIPTAIVHFPIVAKWTDRKFGGMHTLLVRRVPA